MLEEALDRDLQTHGLQLSEYEIISMLSETPGGRLRMSELADIVVQSRSRLTHTATRLEKRGWVVRQPCESDRRGVELVLTDTGRDVVADAAAAHVASVRRHLVDVMTVRSSPPSASPWTRSSPPRRTPTAAPRAPDRPARTTPGTTPRTTPAVRSVTPGARPAPCSQWGLRQWPHDHPGDVRPDRAGPVVPPRRARLAGAVRAGAAGDPRRGQLTRARVPGRRRHPALHGLGEGPWLTDADGRRYVDLICSWGPMILGHAHRPSSRR